jgi:two-component system LytT family response regulator
VELVNAVQKAQMQVEYEQHLDNLKNLFETLKNPRDKKNKIAVATQPGLELVPVEDIIRCEASGGYTVLHLKNKKHIVSSKDLKSFNELLEDYDFYRVHDSHLIAYSHICKVLNEDGGVVLTNDNSKIPISRRRKNDFQAWLKRNTN